MGYYGNDDGYYYDDQDEYKYRALFFPEVYIAFEEKVKLTALQQQLIKEIIEEAIDLNTILTDDMEEEPDVRDVQYNTEEINGKTYFNYSCTYTIYGTTHDYDDDLDEVDFDKAGYLKHVKDVINLFIEKGELPKLTIIDMDTPFFGHTDWDLCD